ncbi:MAG: aspartate--tRNA ligase [Candidatus Delongbacteria bacterium]|nr:aspartate--tRNA ligase [Candidatus Delongbacteria bacterium]MBN2834287.1 aspartate--tRNA ligase [Candidatus Delongbacteria bacterium]
MKRTNTCGELRKADAGKAVILSGWVHKYRNLGGLLFIDLRDRYGITQVIFDPDKVSVEMMEEASKIRNEYVITIKGEVSVKPAPNKALATGEIEIIASDLQIENKSETPPFNFLNGMSDAKEDLRLEYRYLDLRSERMTRNLVLRHKVNMAIRNYLSDRDFIEYETPTFSKSTPEGARDYLIPSRLYPGEFFALPQSPQIYKQLLMVAGQDKYFQIARCYRDEDSRKDRQPEFTQIDIEQSFVTQNEIFELGEGMIKSIFKQAMNIDIPTPFVRIPYAESMELYGVDKPDLRFGLTLKNITEETRNSSFKVFIDAPCVKFIAVEGLENLSRKQIAEYEDYAKHLGAKGLAFVKYVDGNLDGGIAKFLSDVEKEAIISKSELKSNGIIFFGADKEDMANKVLGALRNRFGEELKLFNPDEYRFCWIVDFPMFAFNEEENRWEAMHHMFTMPKPEFIENLRNSENLDHILGQLYDLVANGVELASGSIRIHDTELQEKVFSTLGMPKEEYENKFGFMLNAFKYGAPPHGGMAAGIDRLVQILCKEETIRDVIAFPKAKNQNCLMMNAPSKVDEAQLDELHIQLKKN